MKRSKRLQPVVDLAELKSKQGLQAIAYMQRRLLEENEKMEQLLSCRQEYENGNTVTKQSFNASYLKSLRDFSANLDVALEQQSRQILTVESQLEEVRAVWQKLDAKSRSLQKTQSKIAGQERALADKNEQKSLDEFVIQSSARAKTIQRH